MCTNCARPQCLPQPQHLRKAPSVSSTRSLPLAFASTGHFKLAFTLPSPNILAKTAAVLVCLANARKQNCMMRLLLSCATRQRNSIPPLINHTLATRPWAETHLLKSKLAFEVDEQPTITKEEVCSIFGVQESCQVRVQHTHNRPQPRKLRVHPSTVRVEVALQLPVAFNTRILCYVIYSSGDLHRPVLGHHLPAVLCPCKTCGTVIAADHVSHGPAVHSRCCTSSSSSSALLGAKDLL